MSQKKSEMSLIFFKLVGLPGIKRKLFYNQIRAWPMQTSAKDTKDPLRLCLAHWYRRHSDGIEVGSDGWKRSAPGPLAFGVWERWRIQNIKPSDCWRNIKEWQGPFISSVSLPNMFVLKKGGKSANSLQSFALMDNNVFSEFRHWLVYSCYRKRILGAFSSFIMTFTMFFTLT